MRVVDYFRHEIWQPRLKDYTGLRRFGLRFLRTLALAGREYRTDQCPLRASALTFYTLVSVVPLLTMALAIARAFGLDTVVQNHIWASLSNQTAMVEKVFTFANALLKSTTNGVVAGVGVAILVWTVTSALSNIEATFDRIWEVAQPRRLVRRITDYVAIVVVGTVLWLASLGIAIALQGQTGSLGARLGIPDLALVTVAVLKIVRFVLIWGLLTAGYVVMTNTRISRRSALLGGLCAVLLYHGVEWLYLGFQIRINNHNAIYGGFAALPLFLTWVQATWMAVLFGAEVAFSDEHCETYGFAPDYSRLTGFPRRLLQLRVVHLLVRSFEQGRGGLTSRQLSEQAEIPVRLLRRLLADLTRAGLISRTRARDERLVAYQPAKGADQLTLGLVIDAIDTYQPGSGTGSADSLPEALRRFHDAVDQSAANVRLADIPFQA